MLAWARQPDESARAFEAFELYRDMGPERSLAKVAQALGKSTGLMERWSRQHDWSSRTRALEDRDEMVRREAVEEHIREGAQDRARREARILEESLTLREKALAQSRFMLDYPLVEQTVIRENDDGTEQTIVYTPARWSKATALSLYAMATEGAARPEDLERGLEADYSKLTDDEVADLVQALEKVVWKSPER